MIDTEASTEPMVIFSDGDKPGIPVDDSLGEDVMREIGQFFAFTMICQQKKS